MVGAAACGFDTSASFNADGSVTVGLKFQFPKSLMQGSNGTTVSGLSPSQIAAANASLQKKYPGAKVTVVTEGDESGALMTIPFKTEKDAFAFMTASSQLSPSGATSGAGLGVNLSNTGGLFTSATHTTSGPNDTYTSKTAPAAMPSPSPGQQQIITDDEVASIFVITFSLTAPHVITSAPGALFTLDRKTAIWNLSWTKPQTSADRHRIHRHRGRISDRNALDVANHAPAPQPAAQAVVTAVATEPAPLEPPAAWPGPPPGAAPPTSTS